MTAPDDAVEEVARAMFLAEWGDCWDTSNKQTHDRYRRRARLTLAVPAVAEAFRKAELLNEVADCSPVADATEQNNGDTT